MLGGHSSERCEARSGSVARSPCVAEGGPHGATSQECETLMALGNASGVACSLEYIVHWWNLLTNFSLLACEWISLGEEDCDLVFIPKW